MTWYTPQDPTPREACPCCGYVTLPERGSCQICRVCFWEDDPFIRDAHHAYSLPNHLTLAEARQNFATFGAAGEQWRKNVLPASALPAIERRPVDLVDPFPPREQCRCCGYVSLPAYGGVWDCGVCRCDDHDEPMHVTPAGGRTLWMERERFARRNITDHRFEWRPLGAADPMPEHACPCCDHVTLLDRGAGYVCPLCNWSDDVVGLPLDVPSLANCCTLGTARARFSRGLKVQDEELVGRVDAEDCALFERRGTVAT